jgi:hypothetical protein
VLGVGGEPAVAGLRHVDRAVIVQEHEPVVQIPDAHRRMVVAAA